MYDLLMFDLDGTLTDPKEGITKCVQYALESCGIIEKNLDGLTRFIGPPLLDSFMEFYNLSMDKALFAVEKYRERFSEKGIYENRVFNGVDKMLDILSKDGKIIALATSKPQEYALKILENYRLSKYFDIKVGAEFDGTRSEKKDVIKEVLLQCPQAKSPIMIGDRKQDVLGAKLNGVPCIGVRFGYAEKDELEIAGAEFIADSIKELTQILLKELTQILLK